MPAHIRQGAAVGFLLDGKVFAPELQRKDRHSLRLTVALSGARPQAPHAPASAHVTPPNQMQNLASSGGSRRA